MRKKAKIFRHFLHANFYLFDEIEIALAQEPITWAPDSPKRLVQFQLFEKLTHAN